MNGALRRLMVHAGTISVAIYGSPVEDSALMGELGLTKYGTLYLPSLVHLGEEFQTNQPPSFDSESPHSMGHSRIQ